MNSVSTATKGWPFKLVAKCRQFGGGGNRRHRLAIAPRSGRVCKAYVRAYSVHFFEARAAMTDRPNGLTYAQAGVDIDAGDALVERIKPLAKPTRRPGADASLGGFGALFDLKAAGYDDPLLVTTTDGVGTKLKLAIATGMHDTVGIDLVAMCVNDLLAQGAEPLFFLDYFATGKLDVEAADARGRRHRRGLPAGRLRALVGGETAEMPGMYAAGRLRPGRLLRRRGRARRRCCRELDGQRAGDVLIGLAPPGLHSNGYSLVRRIVERSGLAWDAPAPVRGRQDPGRGAAGADAHLREDRAAADLKAGPSQGRRPHHRRRPDREPAARASPTGLVAAVRLERLGRCRRCSTGCSDRRRRRPRDAAHLQLRRRLHADRRPADRRVLAAC